jgi:hypothetical protein
VKTAQRPGGAAAATRRRYAPCAIEDETMKAWIANSQVWIAGVLVTLAAAAGAGEPPPADGMRLSAIVKAVEAKDVGIITGAEFDDGLWEVKTRQGKTAAKPYLDPRSGAQKRRKAEDADDEMPPAGSKPLSEIIRALEEQSIGVITSVEFDDGYWEVEFRRDGAKRKLDIDPRTGAMRR